MAACTNCSLSRKSVSIIWPLNIIRGFLIMEYNYNKLVHNSFSLTPEYLIFRFFFYVPYSTLRVIYKLLRVISAAHRYCHSLRLIEQNFAVLLEETILDGAIINHSELCSLKLLNKHPLSVSVEAQDMSVICLLVSRKKSNSCSRS